MHIRPNTLAVDDYTPTAPAAASVEPMRKADHKSKRHPKPRPDRMSETLGGGHFVFRRHVDGRIHPRQDPFEHGTLDEAVIELERLTEMHGGTFEVFSRAGVDEKTWRGQWTGQNNVQHVPAGMMILPGVGLVPIIDIRPKGGAS